MPRKKAKGPPERIVGVIESVRLLALAEKDPLQGATRQFVVDDAGTIISVLATSSAT